MTEPAVWRPSRRRLTDALLTALAPVAACALALGGLAVWTASGAAGTPARIKVTSGRVFLPFGESEESAAFFRISNSGDADDVLTRVTSTAADGAMLGRNTTTDGNTGSMRAVDSATVPAGGTLAMSPQDLDVMVTVRGTWRAGDLVPFVLHFRHSGRVKTLAVVVRPGTDWQAWTYDRTAARTSLQGAAHTGRILPPRVRTRGAFALDDPVDHLARSGEEMGRDLRS
ncbi:copper chaperone PCu(A)C [Streptomyces sp. NPDC001530]|uniref:copper chaperone PCu(A)C n=1 Tax=Streptomyces sp. NPDC001530 TaxID=3364582 RepID=UPI0036A1F593